MTRKRGQSGSKPAAANRGKKAPPAAPSSRSKAKLSSDISRNAAAAEKAAADEGIEPAQPGPPPAGEQVDIEQLRQAHIQAEQAGRTYRACADQAKQRERKATQLVERYERDLATLDQTRADHARDTQAIEDLRRALEERDKNLHLREQQVHEREVAAEAGFQQLADRVRADEEAKLARVKAEITEARCAFEDEQTADRRRQQDKLDAERATWEERLAKERVQLAAEHQGIVNLRQQLTVDQGRLQVDRESVEAEREQLADLVDARAARHVADLERRTGVLDEKLTSAHAEITRLEGEAAERKDAVAVFGGRTPPEMAKLVRQLEDDNARLATELAARPDVDALERLDQLTADHQSSQQERAWLKQRNNELTIELSNARVGVAELGQLRDTETAYRTIVEGYQHTMEELEARYGQLVERGERDTAFPRCSAMDEEPSLKVSPVLSDEVPDLPDLVEHIQGLILHDTDDPLIYRPEDIRSFLAGLATSRLHLLHGISGIGKTSLPRAFAKAIGAGHAIVEVQAGWRDRQDLFGYYNTFERQFHETKFLQALYRAQRTAHQDRPFFIVLDEMNLSHPEQYFAELLSKLAKPTDEPIELVPRSVGDPPRHLVDGRAIRLPDNVWFIGTANRDETTVDFADKTYDRAYVLELPYPRPTIDDVPSRGPLTPLSMRGLHTAFAAAERNFGVEGDEVCKFLGGPLRDELLLTCGIGWGDRLESQVRRYTAVVVAAGGTRAEVTDHVLATKILRKVRGVYEINAQSLADLDQALLRCWREAKLPGKPDAAQALLSHEQRIRGGY